MSTREIIAQELERLPKQDLDKLLAFLRSLKESRAESALPVLAAESALAKDWLTPEEDFAFSEVVFLELCPPSGIVIVQYAG